MTNLAWAVLFGLAFYGIVNLIGDVYEFVGRHRADRVPLASIHDFEEARRSLRQPRSLP